MSRIRSEREVPTLGPFMFGANNVVPEPDMPRGQYRRGVNIDLVDGKPQRRQGAALAFSISGGCNSGWSDGKTAFYRTGGALYRFFDNAPPIQLTAALQHDSDMVYGVVNDGIYISDGARAWRFDPMRGTLRPWGVTSPAGQPICSGVTAGGLFGGSYQVACTFATNSGEESGTGEAEMVQVPDNGGIQLTALPVSYEPHVTKINIYRTRVNSAELLFAASVPIGTSTFLLGNQQLGRELKTMHYRVLPPSQAGFAFVNGRLFVTYENMVFWSDSGRPGLYDPTNNFVMLPYTVDMLVGTAEEAQVGGVFIASGDKTYFMGGQDPGDFSLVLRHHAGVIRGTPAYVPGIAFKDVQIPPEHVPVWASTSGSMCVGLPDGTVKPLTDGKYSIAVGARGSAVFRELQGVRHLLLTIEPPTEHLSVVAEDALEITVVKNGVPV